MDWSLTASTSPAVDYTEWTDEAIAVAIADLTAETHRRALARSDPEAVTEHAYQTGFTPAGDPLPPWITSGGLLIVPGAKHIQSSTRHRCTFAAVDGEWAWNHPGAVADTMRTTDIAGKPVIQSVTLIPAVEGTTIDVITSLAKRGPCQAQRTVSYRIHNAALHPTGTATRTPGAHR